MSGQPTAHRILIVHRAPEVAAQLRRLLQGDGHQVSCAASAPEARIAQQTFAPDLLLVESALPGRDGLERGDGLSSRPVGLRFEDLALDETTHEVRRSGTPLDLTETEFRLLRFLMSHPERVLTRPQLLEHVWDYDFGGDARVLETYVCYLRRKLEAHGDRLIHTVRGVGYVLRPSRSLRNPSPPHTPLRRRPRKVSSP